MAFSNSGYTRVGIVAPWRASTSLNPGRFSPSIRCGLPSDPLHHVERLECLVDALRVICELTYADNYGIVFGSHRLALRARENSATVVGGQGGAMVAAA